MKQTVQAVLVTMILAIAWFLVSPLFVDRTVDEDFDYMLDSGRVDVGAVMQMPDAMRDSMQDEIMAAAAAAPDLSADDAMPASAPVIVASGRFSDADAVHKGSGTASLYRLPDGAHLLRFEDFRTTNGPDLVVYLAEHPDPSSAADVTEGGFLSLGKLKGNVGNQNYALPAEIDPGDYESVVIWCELFGVLFSPAPLSRVQIEERQPSEES
jgi:hypothetical protein